MLIVAASARSLGVSALRGGRHAVLLDYFADEDTCALGLPVQRISVEGSLRPERAQLLAAADALASPSSGVVYGSGFEDCPGLLAELAHERRLFGNAPAVLASAKEPRTFFPLLDSLGIPHPETRSVRPHEPDGWLAKRAGGTGGAHVVPLARCTDDSDDIYYQRREAGRSLSALFLADGRRACVIGFNEQLHVEVPGLSPFLFAGLIGPIDMPAAQAQAVMRWIDALVAALGLVGLNGIDFMLREDDCSLIELNPRPTAALELYDAEWPSGLVDAHVRACDGELPGSVPVPRLVRGHAIVFAGKSGKLAFQPPDWCSDLAPSGTVFAAGDPVCTVHASGPDGDSVRGSLYRRRGFVEGHLVSAKAA